MEQDGGALQRVQSYQYPATHVGHLAHDQIVALERFKTLSAQKGYYRAAQGGQRASHDDETLLRYLRARKFVPNDAFGQFKDTEDWRKENKIDDLYNTIDINEYEETRRLYPQWTGCRDKRGIPLYVYEVAHLTSKRMSEYEKSCSSSNSKTVGSVSPKLIRLFALYENLLNFALPLASGIPGRQYPETPVSQSNNIVDISGVGLKQFWNLKQHMQDASTLATAHYPETLDRIFIIGAPSFFPTVWGWIKRWFDPITVSKIFILAQHEVHPTLAKYVDESCIPKKYGGKLNWEWGQPPAVEPAIINAMKWEGGRTFPSGPVRFEQDKAGNLIAYAVGSEKGQRRHAKIATLPAREDVTTLAVHQVLSRTEAPESSGWHTHPTAGQQTMPTSGHTPPNHSPEISPMVMGGANGATQQQRAGASFGRSDTPGQTHSSEQLAESRPVNNNRHYADAQHATYNPSTVGQAPKTVDLPYREAPQGQDTSYLGQAKAALNSAVVAAEGAEEAVLERLGYGHKQETHPQEQKQEVADDPRVDAMPKQSLEDYLRSQTADYDRPGHHR